MAQRKSIIDILKCRLFCRHLSSRHKGFYYERKACRYLKRQGLRLINKNFRCAGGEIDLIMQDREELVFIEVRSRQHPHCVNSLESVDYFKQQKLLKAAEYYLQIIKDPESPCRFDIVCFDQDKLAWIKNAF